MRPHALHPGAIQGKEGIKFCHLATLAQVLLKSSFYSAVAVYVLLGILAAVVAMFLPVESLGQSLDDAAAAGGQSTKAEGGGGNKEREETD